LILQIEILVSFILATATLAISPGPDNVFVLIQTISYGKRKGMAIVCGLISGCVIHTSVVAFGLSTVIQSRTKLLFGLKLIGAFYLLYLAYSTYASENELNIDKQSDNGTSLVRLFRRGFIMNVINPKVSLFFMAFFPAFLFSKTISLTVQFFSLGLLFMGTSFFIFTMLVFFSGSVASVLRGNKRFESIIKWGQIIVFLIIAIFILITN
jgi:threonine/homoserine/homoserine lactone efflux protein